MSLLSTFVLSFFVSGTCNNVGPCIDCGPKIQHDSGTNIAYWDICKPSTSRHPLLHVFPERVEPKSPSHVTVSKERSASTQEEKFTLHTELLFRPLLKDSQVASSYRQIPFSRVQTIPVAPKKCSFKPTGKWKKWIEQSSLTSSFPLSFEKPLSLTLIFKKDLQTLLEERPLTEKQHIGSIIVTYQSWSYGQPEPKDRTHRIPVFLPQGYLVASSQ